MQATEQSIAMFKDALANAQAREGLLRDTLQVNHEYLEEMGVYTVEEGLKNVNKATLGMPYDDTALQLVLAQRGDIVEAVRSFNLIAGNTHDHFNVRQSALYAGLQCEELGEKMLTLGFVGMSGVLKDMATGFKEGAYDNRFDKVDRVGLLDDDVDLLVVTIGSMLSQGANVHGAVQEVHRANMGKIWPDGTMHRDSNGKVLKPDGWVGPDLSPFIDHADQVEPTPQCDMFLDDLGLPDLGVAKQSDHITG